MPEQLEIKIGHENFANYKRLAYKWWYALAEFVDNASQSYFDNRPELDSAFTDEQEVFRVVIVTGKDFIRINDNAMGMDLDALSRAMLVGVPPANSTGRCRYGLGMKTAACWIGDSWKIITTKLGDPTEYTVEVNVGEIVKGNMHPPTEERAVEESAHYTTIEIREHNRPMRGRTISKVKEYLASIYRIDIASSKMVLTYNDEELEWTRYQDDEFLARRDGGRYRQKFIFEIDSQPEKKVVEGWVGVLQKGSRSKAGFSILHRQRVIKGWPDSWRPEKIYGQGGRNDLINQRLVGEINLEDFEVTHTKDDINWSADEEELVEAGLKDECSAYMEAARKARKGQVQGHGPEPVHVDAAVKTLEAELSTPEFLDKLNLDDALPPLDQIEASNHHVLENARATDPTFVAQLGDTRVSVFIDDTGSPNDPYFINEEVADHEVVILVNQLHPHWSMLEGENSVVNYLRHCVYDGVAEHRARLRARLESDSIKRLKDNYLRVAFELLQQEGEVEGDGEAESSGSN